MFTNDHSFQHENPYPEYTALKPLDDRVEQMIHPARIVDPSDAENFYNYSWNSPQESTSVLNWVCLGIMLSGIAVLAIFLAKT